MDKTISKTPKVQAEANAFHAQFQIIESKLLTTYDGSNRKEAALDYMHRSIRNAYQVFKNNSLNKVGQSAFYKADKVASATHKILLRDVVELAESIDNIIEGGHIKCEVTLEAFAEHEEMLKKTYALLLMWEAKYGLQMSL